MNNEITSYSINKFINHFEDKLDATGYLEFTWNDPFAHTEGEYTEEARIEAMDKAIAWSEKEGLVLSREGLNFTAKLDWA
jgi:hypothetical protein